jgi:acyl-coenzyme A thioesterase 9
MEVFVKMEGKRLGSTESDTLMLGRFSMVCRDAHTNKARRVPPLIIESEEEKMLWQIGQEHKESRTEFNQASLDKKPPTEEEATELHRFMLEVKGKEEYKGEKIVEIDDTTIQNVAIMFPQERNLHGKVFGGYLMRMVSYFGLRPFY